MYDEFVRRNPTFENRVDALTSGLLSPDTKALALWAMRPNRAYGKSNLADEVEEFTGGNFPVESAWPYLNGYPQRNCESQLYSTGLIAGSTSTSGENIEYFKTDAGIDFGNAITALTCMIVNKLHASPKRPMYVSMLRILHSRGYDVYKVIKFLAKNPGSGFSRNDIASKLDLSDDAASYALNDLGKAGVIFYHSPSRDIEGKRNCGWSVSVVNDQILEADFNEICNIAKANEFEVISSLENFFTYCKGHVDEEIECNRISRQIGIKKSHASMCISFLRSLGYLEGDIRGREKQSSAKCTEYTMTLWKDLFSDIERVAMRVEAHPELNRALETYRDENLMEQHVRKWVEVYERERIHRGIEHGNLLRQSVMKSLGKNFKKLSDICGEVRDQGFDTSRHNIRRVLISSGKTISNNKGYYRLADS